MQGLQSSGGRIAVLSWEDYSPLVEGLKEDYEKLLNMLYFVSYSCMIFLWEVYFTYICPEF